MSATDDGTIVRARTPRGESTLATVVDREISPCIRAETTVTVEAAGGLRWRVDEDDVTEV